MHCLPSPAKRRSYWLILFLTTALLATQWIGVMHRVIHSGLTAATTQTAPLASLQNLIRNTHEGSSHSCDAFDGATLAHAIGSLPVILPVVNAQFDIDQRVAFRSWSAPFFPCFSSRAPPLA